MVADFLRYCEYELLHLILEEEAVRSEWGVVCAKALLISLLAADDFLFLTVYWLCSCIPTMTESRY